MWFLYAFYALHETDALNPARGRVTVARAEPTAVCVCIYIYVYIYM
jgi:hypothetical protein